MRTLALTAACWAGLMAMLPESAEAGLRARIAARLRARLAPPLIVPYDPYLGGPYVEPYGAPVIDGYAPYGPPPGFGISVHAGPASFTYYRGPVGGAPLYPLPPAGPIDYGANVSPLPAGPAAPALPPGGLAGGAWEAAPAAEPVAKPSLLARDPSTPAARQKSLEAQADGDMWFRRQEYHRAYDRYKVAIAAAWDRPEPYLRLALTFAALGHFRPAVRELKRGIEVSPEWIREADLDALFGPDGGLAKSSVVQRVMGWAREDVRDPDRLYLLGALLYLDGDQERSRPLLDAARRFSVETAHIAPFLQSPAPARADAAKQAPALAPPPTPLPEPAAIQPAAAEEDAPPPVGPPQEEAPSGPLLPPLPSP